MAVAREEVLVVGAGIGGLAAALPIAAGGTPVRIIESAERPGGKAGVVEIDGVRVDTGPSVLTLPDVFEGLFARAGMRLDDVIGLRRLDPGFRYRYADGCVLEVAHDPDDTLARVRAALGAGAEAELASFLAYSRGIWESAAPHFVLGPAPSWPAMVSLALRHPLALRAVDPLRSMTAGIDRHVREPHLRMLLRRYATYNGSDPRRAPATLNCIAHVELSLGGFGVQGGISAVVRALVEAIEDRGGVIECDTMVERLLVEGGAAVGVQLAGGGQRRGRAVVVNADVGWLRNRLPHAGRALPAASAPSMSGWTAMLRAARLPDRFPHEVIFPADYEAEFSDIFDHDRPPTEPTVYLCAQERCHGVAGWPDAEPVFVMANAPAEPAVGTRPPKVWKGLEAAVEHRMREAGVWADGDALVWRRTPGDLAAAFPGSRGAIYGAASNDRFAAFKRPPNRVADIPGLYLASGSAHPGGGVPMAALSGLAAADCLSADLSLPAQGAGRSQRPMSAETLTCDPVTAALLLLGGVIRVGEVTARIVEVEAYGGPPDGPWPDAAAHSYRGPTLRNAVMFGPPGRLYTYRSHGIHVCANVSCGGDGDAAAVLLRAAVIENGAAGARVRRGSAVAEQALARGPGNLCSALGIGMAHNGIDVFDSASDVVVELGSAASADAGPRVGVSQAADRPWRFWLPDSPAVSAYRRSPRAPRPGCSD